MMAANLFISRTPYRVSFFGGGTDYPEWYEQHEGRVLSMAIDKYCYITCRYLPVFFEKKFRVVWSHIETVDTISEILHPCVREALKFLEFDNTQGIEIHHQGDLPARTGIGSSSSFSVGLIKALLALKGANIDKKSLVQKSIHLERAILREIGGVQDQYATAYGGVNVISLKKEGVHVSPVAITKAHLDAFCSNLILVYTGSSRISSEVSGSIAQSFHEKRSYLHLMVEQAVYGEELLVSGKWDEFGKLLGEAWNCKKKLNKNVATLAVDEMYEKGLKAGALGGKLIGGGGSGFILFYVPFYKQMPFRQAFENCIRVRLKADYEGSVLLAQTPQKNPLANLLNASMDAKKEGLTKVTQS